MIQIRRKEAGKDEEFIDLTNSQVELVTTSDIYQFLGKKGLLDEVRFKNDIFTGDLVVERALSKAIDDGMAEIYFGSEDFENERYTIIFAADTISCLYSIRDLKVSSEALVEVSHFLEDYVCKDEQFLPLLEPNHIGVMWIIYYWCLKNGSKPTYDEMREMFDKVYDVVDVMEETLPDMESPYEFICKILGEEE